MRRGKLAGKLAVILCSILLVSAYIAYQGGLFGSRAARGRSMLMPSSKLRQIFLPAATQPVVAAASQPAEAKTSAHVLMPGSKSILVLQPDEAHVSSAPASSAEVQLQPSTVPTTQAAR